MKTIINILFPNKDTKAGLSLLLLIARVAFGLLFMNHGLQKAMAFDTLSGAFPDPLGIGSELSLILAIFGEVACSAALIIGLFHRLALIPMIITMLVAFFIVHGADPFAVKELALVYLIVFILLLFAGSGKYSVDFYLGKWLREKFQADNA